MKAIRVGVGLVGSTTTRLGVVLPPVDPTPVPTPAIHPSVDSWRQARSFFGPRPTRVLQVVSGTLFGIAPAGAGQAKGAMPASVRVAEVMFRSSPSSWSSPVARCRLAVTVSHRNLGHQEPGVAGRHVYGALIVFGWREDAVAFLNGIP